MARRGRDLFEILGSRGGGGRGVSKSTKSSGFDLAGVGRGALDVVMGLFGQAAPKRRSPARRRSSQAIGFGPLALLAVMGLCMAGGFALGRWSVDTEPGSTKTLSAGLSQTPESLTTPRRRLSEAQEEEALSQWYCPVMPYELANRDSAARLASWLRAKGFPKARILKAQKDGAKFWLTVCYCSGPDDQEPRKFILSLDPPSFEPRFVRFSQKIPVDPLSLS